MNEKVELAKEVVRMTDAWVAENNPKPLVGEYECGEMVCWIGAAKRATNMTISQVEDIFHALGDDGCGPNIIDFFDNHEDFKATSEYILKWIAENYGE